VARMLLLIPVLADDGVSRAAKAVKAAKSPFPKLPANPQHMSEDVAGFLGVRIPFAVFLLIRSAVVDLKAMSRCFINHGEGPLVLLLLSACNSFFTAKCPILSASLFAVISA